MPAFGGFRAEDFVLDYAPQIGFEHLLPSFSILGLNCLFCSSMISKSLAAAIFRSSAVIAVPWTEATTLLGITPAFSCAMIGGRNRKIIEREVKRKLFENEIVFDICGIVDILRDFYCIPFPRMSDCKIIYNSGSF
jgi:hypothetical protein